MESFCVTNNACNQAINSISNIGSYITAANTNGCCNSTSTISISSEFNGLQQQINTTEQSIRDLLNKINAQTLQEEHIKEQRQKIDELKKEIKMKSDIINFEFGPVTSTQFRLSPYGIAVCTKDNGWVAYDVKAGEIVNVNILNFDVSKILYKMPVAFRNIKVGDILMHSGKPVFVRELHEDGTINVIDYSTASMMNILPVRSPFGFNFYTKICSLMNIDTMTADSDNPFGNMLPFFMLNGEDGSNIDPMVFLMLNGRGFNFEKNPMMLYLLMNNKTNHDWLPLMLMMNGNNFFEVDKEEAKSSMI